MSWCESMMLKARQANRACIREDMRRQTVLLKVWELHP